MKVGARQQLDVVAFGGARRMNYLHAYDGVDEARAAIGRYTRFRDQERSRMALGCQTPPAFYDGLRLAA